MPDTHDERGGDDAALRVGALVVVVDNLRELLAAATARAEKAEARLAKLVAGLEVDDKSRELVQQNRRELDAVIQQHINALMVENCELRTRVEAADAAQDGRSATETDADGSQGSGVELEFGSGSAGLSEPQAPADCDEPNADGTCRHLTCGRCKQHTNDTHQGHYWAWCKVAKTTREFHFCCPGDCELERTDTTEDGRHG